MSALSEQYAVALFDVANDLDAVSDVQEEFKNLVDNLDVEAMKFFEHPGIEKVNKRQLIASLNMIKVFENFLNVLIDNGRFDQLKIIKDDFDELINNRYKRMHVVVYSKRPLDKKRQDNLKEQYEKKYNRQVTIENRVDNNIAGGLRFEFEGKVIDDTINHTLRQMKSRLTK